MCYLFSLLFLYFFSPLSLCASRTFLSCCILCQAICSELSWVIVQSTKFLVSLQLRYYMFNRRHFWYLHRSEILQNTLWYRVANYVYMHGSLTTVNIKRMSKLSCMEFKCDNTWGWEVKFLWQNLFHACFSETSTFIEVSYHWAEKQSAE